MNPTESRILFSEILNGLSPAHHPFFKNIYIKHFSYCESGALETEYYNYLDIAKSKKLPTYKQQEEYILRELLWTKKDEDNIKDEENLIRVLRENSSKSFLYSKRQQFKSEIKAAELRLHALRLKKDHYIGNTAEQFAHKKLTYYKIVNSYFKDKKLQEPLIIDEDEENEDNYYELIKLYNFFQDRFSIDNIKKISLSPFFTNLFYMAGDSIYEFYGKPIVELTDYQSNLIMYGKYFKNILSENSNFLPDDVKNNPDELMEWMSIRTNAREQGILKEDDSEGGSMSIVGGTKNDLKVLGLNVPQNNPMTEALKKKGSLSKEDLYQLSN